MNKWISFTCAVRLPSPIGIQPENGKRRAKAQRATGYVIGIALPYSSLIETFKLAEEIALSAHPGEAAGRFIEQLEMRLVEEAELKDQMSRCASKDLYLTALAYFDE